MKKNLLKNLRLSELSLVDRGANQHARVSLFKSADGEPTLIGRLLGFTKSTDEPTHVDTLAENVDAIIKDAGLDAAMRLDLLDAALDEFKKSVLDEVVKDDDSDEDDDAGDDSTDEGDTGDSDVPDVSKQVPDAGASTGESHTTQESVMKTGTREAVLKGLDPAAREYIESIEKAAKDAEASAAQAVTKAADAERLAIAKELVVGTPFAAADVSTVLKQLDEAGQAVVKSMIAKTGELQKSSELFKEAGSAHSTAPSADSEIEKAATELQKAHPTLTRAQAIRKAYDTNPDAYEASLSA